MDREREEKERAAAAAKAAVSIRASWILRTPVPLLPCCRESPSFLPSGFIRSLESIRPDVLRGQAAAVPQHGASGQASASKGGGGILGVLGSIIPGWGQAPKTAPPAPAAPADGEAPPGRVRCGAMGLWPAVAACQSTDSLGSTSLACLLEQLCLFGRLQCELFEQSRRGP